MKITFLLVPIFVLGCSNFHRDDKPLQVEGNQRIVEVNQSVVDLQHDDSIVLEPLNSNATTESAAKNFDWSKYSDTDRAAIEKRLNGVVSNVSRIMKITQDKDMRVSGSLDDVLEAGVNATYFLKSAQTYDQSHQPTLR